MAVAALTRPGAWAVKFHLAGREVTPFRAEGEILFLSSSRPRGKLQDGPPQLATELGFLGHPGVEGGKRYLCTLSSWLLGFAASAVKFCKEITSNCVGDV